MKNINKKIFFLLLIFLVAFIGLKVNVVYASSEAEELKELLSENEENLGNLQQFKEVIDGIYNDLNDSSTIFDVLLLVYSDYNYLVKVIKSNNDSVKAEDGISWYDLNAIFYIEELDNTLGKENKTGFLKYKDSYVVNPDGDKVNPLMMLIGEKDGESYGEMYIFDNDRNVYTINLDDIVNGKEKIETSKYNSKDIIDLSITTKYSVPTVKDLKDYYFDNYQVKVIYSDNKEEMFEGKNILSGTVLDFD